MSDYFAELQARIDAVAERTRPPEPPKIKPGTLHNTNDWANDMNVFDFRAEDGGILDAWLNLRGHLWHFAAGFERWYRWNVNRWQADDSNYAIRAEVTWLTDIMNRKARTALAEVKDDDKKAARAKRQFISQYVSATRRSRSRVESVEGLARNIRFIDSNQFDSIGVLNLLNGTLDLHTLKLRKHDPADLLTYCLPYDYDPEAQAPNWAALIADLDPEIASFLQEFAGYSLTPDTKHELAVWLYGPPGGGKSTFLAGLEAMLGPKVGLLGLADIERSRFALADLPGKTLAISAEQPGDFLASTHILNAVISGEPIMVDRKFLPAVKITPRAKLAWAMNDFPRVSDANNGIFRRVKVVNFPAVPEDRRCPGLKNAIAEEGAGVLNWALAGLARLQRRGRFAIPAAVEGATRDFVMQNDIPANFIADCCTVGAEHKIGAGALYDAYRAWAIETGHKPQSATTIAQDWKRLGFTRVKERTGNFYEGVQLAKNIIDFM
jgi:putative DNA primase/helicase